MALPLPQVSRRAIPRPDCGQGERTLGLDRRADEEEDGRPARLLSGRRADARIQARNDFRGMRKNNPYVLSLSKFLFFPTLQNLRIENRLLRRENRSGVWVELNDFSLNMIFLANYVVG